MSKIIRPSSPVNLQELLKESPAASNSNGMPFWKMLIYFILLFIAINIIQFFFDKYKKNSLAKDLNLLRVGDNIIINNTIQGQIQRIDHKEIYLHMSNSSVIAIKKDIITHIKVVKN